MATYTYDTNADEDAALDLELMMINGQLVSQKKPPVDLQGMFVLFVQQHLRPLVENKLTTEFADVRDAYFKGDDSARKQILAAVSDKKQ